MQLLNDASQEYAVTSFQVNQVKSPWCEAEMLGPWIVVT